MNIYLTHFTPLCIFIPYQTVRKSEIIACNITNSFSLIVGVWEFPLFREFTHTSTVRSLLRYRHNSGSMLKLDRFVKFEDCRQLVSVLYLKWLFVFL